MKIRKTRVIFENLNPVVEDQITKHSLNQTPDMTIKYFILKKAVHIEKKLV